jgi:hypothetical protein
MIDDIVTGLVQEIHDLLDVSSVGLYEFLWQLNTPEQTLSLDERKHVARQALEILLQDPAVKIVRLRWPEGTPIEELSLDLLPMTAWNDPDEEGVYVGIDRDG